jgi:hypothetical protein
MLVGGLRLGRSSADALLLAFSFDADPCPRHHPRPGTDGVPEINQTCAVQTGCFPGDTAGFPVTISGPNACSGDPVTTCTVASGGAGVLAPQILNVTVENGTIRGTGSSGIVLGKSGRVRDLVLIDNGNNGIECLNGCQVLESTVQRTGANGIYQRSVTPQAEIGGSRFVGNVVSGNGAVGSPPRIRRCS